MRVAARRFSGVTGDEEKIFRPGDRITEAEAKELGLDGKPGLAVKEGQDGAQIAQA